MGRPKKEISKDQFEKLCALQCTKEEICSFLEVSDKLIDKFCKETYKRSFSEVFAEKREVGKISLRRNQWKLSEKSAAMAIFLGKNYLGQTDKVQVTDEREDDGFIDALKEGAKVWEE